MPELRLELRVGVEWAVQPTCGTIYHCDTIQCMQSRNVGYIEGTVANINEYIEKLQILSLWEADLFLPRVET